MKNPHGLFFYAFKKTSLGEKFVAIRFAEEATLI